MQTKLIARPGFTLVELLVVIAIIGILMALTLPAIQSARESGRKTQCRNSVKNLSQACISHLEAQKFFPSGGWGYGWAGDPDRGFGMKQCGGWMYNILPYMEETNLHDRGKGLDAATKKALGKERAATPIPLFNCPTRRRPDTFPFSASSDNYYNIDRPDVIARSDYAANGGDEGFTINGSKGPATVPSSPPSAFDAAFTVNRDMSGIVFYNQPTQQCPHQGWSLQDVFGRRALRQREYLRYREQYG